MINTLFLFILLLISCFSSAEDAACLTPDSKKGQCTILNACPSLYSLFETHQTFSEETKKFLRRSQCGVDDSTGRPKVCCPIGPSLASRHLPDKSECFPATESKIVGGREADLDEFPWMVLLEYKESSGKWISKCGGALISKRYVLTASHCKKDNLKRVRLGEYNTTSDPDCIYHKSGTDCNENALTVPIEKMLPYNDPSKMSDIMLLRLSQEINFSDFIKPICLPMDPEEAQRTYINESLVVAGWGITEQNRTSEILLKVNVPVKPLSECSTALRNTHNRNVDLGDVQMCAGGEKGKDSCFGDSGGPLMKLRKNKDKTFTWYIIGITSFGSAKQCGGENKPTIYVKVSKFIKWILDNIEP